MSGRSFLDTNILLYADDDDHPQKQATARSLIKGLAKRGKAVVSTQVMAEYFSAAIRKLGVSVEDARSRVALLRAMPVVLLEPDDVLAAIDLHRLHQLSIWDALVVRAAQRGGCRVLYTEDLRHGQRFDGLEVVNPFG